MTNREIEEKIKKAFTSDIPDVFDSVLAGCEQPQMQKIYTEKKARLVSFKKALSIAAAVAIILTSGIAGFLVAKLDLVDSVISFDVNPSIELEVNKKEKIIEAQPLNKDAEKVLGNMDLKGSDLSVAVNAIIGSMIRNGYIDELSNSILITVDNKDAKKSAELEKKLLDEIKSILNDEDFDSEVISQTINKSKELVKLAETYGITSGKAQLIKQITDKDKKYSFKDLATLTIHQLNSILSGEKVEIATNNTTKKVIGKTKAKSIALEAAGFKKKDIFNLSCELDDSKANMFYKVVFDTDLDEYVYEIDIYSGKIKNSHIEKGIFIGIEKAKKIAFEVVGTTEEEITHFYYSFYNEEYFMIFRLGLVEYRVGVDAHLAEVVSLKPQGPKNPNMTQSYINPEDAKKMAAEELLSPESEIFDCTCTLTKNGNLTVYEVVFKGKRETEEGIKEYKSTFIVNAFTGDVIGINRLQFIDEEAEVDTQSDPAETDISQQQEIEE